MAYETACAAVATVLTVGVAVVSDDTAGVTSDETDLSQVPFDDAVIGVAQILLWDGNMVVLSATGDVSRADVVVCNKIFDRRHEEFGVSEHREIGVWCVEHTGL